MSAFSDEPNNVVVPSGAGEKAAPPRKAKSTGDDPRAQPTPPEATGLRDMVALVRGNSILILLAMLLSLGAGWGYLVLAPPRYLASATLLIAPAPSPSPVPEEYYIESQTQTMRSDPVVRAVVERLALAETGIAADDKAFFIDQARAAKRFLARFIPTLAAAKKNGDAVQEAMQILRRNLTIERPAMTPIMTVSYNSTDAARAAAIVNALIDAATAQRRGSEIAATQQSVAWLTERLGELRLQNETAQRAVESFRAANNIVGNGSNQSLQAEQRLYELSIQLEAARAAAEAAFPSSGTLSGDDGTVVTLQPAHRVAELRTETATDAPRPVVSEQPAATAAQSEATRRQNALQDAFDAAAGKVREVNRQGARLRELEASAEIYRTLYGNMLLRYEEAAQQSMVPDHAGMQVLIAARQPAYPSHPRPLLVFAFAGVFGIALGIGAAVVREWLALEVRR